MQILLPCKKQPDPSGFSRLGMSWHLREILMSWLLMFFFMRNHYQQWPVLNSLFSLPVHSFSIFLHHSWQNIHLPCSRCSPDCVFLTFTLGSHLCQSLFCKLILQAHPRSRFISSEHWLFCPYLILVEWLLQTRAKQTYIYLYHVQIIVSIAATKPRVEIFFLHLITVPLASEKLNTCSKPCMKMST